MFFLVMVGVNKNERRMGYTKKKFPIFQQNLLWNLEIRFGTTRNEWKVLYPSEKIVEKRVKGQGHFLTSHSEFDFKRRHTFPWLFFNRFYFPYFCLGQGSIRQWSAKTGSAIAGRILVGRYTGINTCGTTFHISSKGTSL